ncbi:hypothetical protein PENSPDRAFT_738432 [Peniophora sp. CONT]|nr:hypothetical protein PENSPDRAFT_738432 [Peniophora sp. CONT]
MIRPLLCHLTSLSLRHGSAKSSLRELYEFLSRAMGLQTLAIRGYAWSSGKDELVDLGILHFPKLRIYHVEGTLSDSTTLFCLLQLPLACRVTIECGLQRRDDFSREMPRLASVITRQGGPFSEILTLEVASRSVPMKCFTMSGWRQDSSTFLMEDFTQDGLPRSVARDEPHCMIIFQGIQAQITGRVSLAVFAPQVSALFDLLPIKQLQNLSFRSSALEYNYTNWGHLSRECVDLNFLRIDKNIIHSFVENAAFSRPYRAPPSVTQIVFLNVHSGSQHSVDMEVIGSVLRDCGNTALTTVVFDGYKPQDLQELLPDLRLQHVQRVLKGDSEDRAALRTNRLSRLGA